MPNIEQVEPIKFTHFIAIKFKENSRTYTFGVKDITIHSGDEVVVDNIKGLTTGIAVGEMNEIANYKGDLALKPVIRLATEIDKRMEENNRKDAVFAMEICKEEIDRLSLEMRLLSCEYSLDKAKILFTYVADDRVDFRELLKALASKLHTRIELRQIGTRDKAKLIGGLGICGLPLCCSTFLNEFDGISISRAKNQMLAINIPKLSGHCGKLLCCLKYEDEIYTKEKEKYPEIGFKVFIDKIEYTVTSVNIVSKVIRVENADDVKILSYNEFIKQTRFRLRKNKNENR